MQKLNCKIGDLAIVVRTELPQNLGQIVEVLSPQTGRPFTMSGRGHAWQVRALSGRATLFYRFGLEASMVQHAEGPVPDRCLRPVSGLADADSVHEALQRPKTAPLRRRKTAEVVKATEETLS